MSALETVLPVLMVGLILDQPDLSVHVLVRLTPPTGGTTGDWDQRSGCLLVGRNVMPSRDSTTSLQMPGEIINPPPPTPVLPSLCATLRRKILTKENTHFFLILGSYLSDLWDAGSGRCSMRASIDSYGYAHRHSPTIRLVVA